MKKVLFHILLILTILSLSIFIGVKDISLNLIFNNKLDDFLKAILVNRVIRTLFGIVAGVSLGISGVLMQSVTRNPISDPSILGVNTGASLFIVLGISFLGLTNQFQYILLALLGAFITSVIVYKLASLGSSSVTPIKLVLSGSIVSIILTSMISIVMLPKSTVMEEYRFWQIGSISSATLNSIILVLPFVILGIVIALAISNDLSVLIIGEDVAISLGVNLSKTRLLACIASVLLCGSITAVAGPIGFIGLMVPHVIRIVFKSSNISNLILLSGYFGALSLIFCDILSRIVARPAELEVGIITALIGAPLFIFIVSSYKVNSL